MEIKTVKPIGNSGKIAMSSDVIGERYYVIKEDEFDKFKLLIDAINGINETLKERLPYEDIDER